MKVDDKEKFLNEVKRLEFIKNIMVVDSDIKMMVEGGENLVATLVNFAIKTTSW